MSLSPDQLQVMMTQDFSQLEKQNNKKDLCQFISHLRSKVEELESYKLISKRVQNLAQRSAFLPLQGSPHFMTTLRCFASFPAPSSRWLDTRAMQRESEVPFFAGLEGHNRLRFGMLLLRLLLLLMLFLLLLLLSSKPF